MYCVAAMTKLCVCLFVFVSFTVVIGAFKSHRVTRMPGQPSFPKLSQFSGLVTVNEKHGRALFYWFFEALQNPHEKPLLLWLNGGPGCSSIGYGAAVELGPLIVKKDGVGLRFNEFTWCKEANLLFLDSPIGTGFSYTNTSSDFTTLDDEFVANDVYAFLVKWMEMFPNFKYRDFYLAGESYAGHYVPQLAELLCNKIDARKNAYINLKGFMVWNPSTDDYYDNIGFLDFAWSHGIISDDENKEIRRACDLKQPSLSNHCIYFINLVSDYYSKIDIYNIYAPKCLLSSSSKVENIKNHKSSGISGGLDPCYDIHVGKYFNRLDVQSAMHIGNTFIEDWQTCNTTLILNYNFTVTSVLPIYKKLVTTGLRIWVFSGDLDGRVSFLGTRYWVEALGLRPLSSWRPWYTNYQDQMSGRVILYEGLTFVTVRDAGHLVPRDQPLNSLFLFFSFLSNHTFPM